MSSGLHTQNDNATNRSLIDGLKQALDMNYARMLETARREWERNFAGKDSSDACSSVRVTSGNSEKSLPCTGIIRRRRRSLLNSNGRP